MRMDAKRIALACACVGGIAFLLAPGRAGAG